jgi:hypothetical protein
MLLLQGWARMKWNLPPDTFGSLNEDITSLRSFSVASGDATETLDTDFCILVCRKFWADCVLIYTECQVLMKPVGSNGSKAVQFMMKVMVWYTLWVMLTMLQPDSFLSCSFGFAKTDVIGDLDSVILEFSLQTHRYWVSLWPWKYKCHENHSRHALLLILY